MRVEAKVAIRKVDIPFPPDGVLQAKPVWRVGVGIQLAQVQRGRRAVGIDADAVGLQASRHIKRGLGIISPYPHSSCGSNEELPGSGTFKIYHGVIRPNEGSVVTRLGPVTGREGVITFRCIGISSRNGGTVSASSVANATADGGIVSAGGISRTAADGGGSVVTGVALAPADGGVASAGGIKCASADGVSLTAAPGAGPGSVIFTPSDG